MKEIIQKQIGENPHPFKVFLFTIKAFSGVIGTTMVIEQSHPYIATMFLGIGAVADQLIQLYNWDNK